MTIAAITSSESEVIAFHSIFFCQGVGYKICSKMGTTYTGCNEKAFRSSAGFPPVDPERERRTARIMIRKAFSTVRPALKRSACGHRMERIALRCLYLNGYTGRMSDL